MSLMQKQAEFAELLDASSFDSLIKSCFGWRSNLVIELERRIFEVKNMSLIIPIPFSSSLIGDKENVDINRK